MKDLNILTLMNLDACGFATAKFPAQNSEGAE